MLWTPRGRSIVRRPYSPVNTRAREILHRLGQLPDLQLLLDAGDSASIGVGATKWLDLSGNGFDFNFGTAAGADAADPTFNGVPGGLSHADYLSFDGADCLTYDTTNATWMQNLHKNNALFSMYCWAYGAGAGTGQNLNNSFFGTSGNSPSNIGVYMRADATAGGIRFEVQDGSGTAALVLTSHDGIYRSGAWNFVGLGLDEANNFADLVVNQYAVTFNAAYNTPSASNASFALNIGARGNNIASFPPDGRIGQIAFWTRFIRRNELFAIRDATSGRYAGLTAPWGDV